jgi:hypothetical protein
MMPKPVLVDVGIVAAKKDPEPIKGIDGKPRLNPEDAETLKKCIRNFFEAARLGGSDTLVIVPLGCGAFKNPPGHVCELFVEIMKEYEGVFKKIIFAIIDDKNTHMKHNPEGNYTPFLECVGNYNKTRGQAGGGGSNGIVGYTNKRTTLKNNKLKSRKIKKHASTSISTPTTRFTKKKHHSKHSHNKKHKTRRR